MFHGLWLWFGIIAIIMMLHPAIAAATETVTSANSSVAWWVWPSSLFVVTLLMGIAAVLGGIGGAVLYVPIISGFFPFHLDFVRGTRAFSRTLWCFSSRSYITKV